MPPPGYEPFLRAICENPEDDTVRLVYADWLDENGDPERAEFIRVSIEYLRECKLPGLNRDLLSRYTTASRNVELWKGELPKIPGISWPGAFHRGFAHEIAVSDGRHLLRNRDVVFNTAPVDSVSIADAGLATLARVLELSEMSRVSQLLLHHCRVQPGEWDVVASCPYLARLDFLSLARPFQQPVGGIPQPLLSDADARVLAGSPFLPRELKLQLQGWISPAATAVLRERFSEVKTYHPPAGAPA